MNATFSRAVGSAPSRRGAAKMGCIVAVAIVVILVVGIGGCGVSTYNNMIALQEPTDSKWSDVENQYKRRYDLVPQLVETVKGAADFERSTITDVTEARARVGQVTLPQGAPTDPAQLEAYAEAQGELGRSLGRLLLVAERYPELRATQNFLSLQDQLEGTENRIAVARTDYIEAVRSYNTAIRRFPANLFASTFGFEQRAQLEVEEEAHERPEIDFGKNE